MICYIYRSPNKLETYLYLKEKDAFDAVPEPLLKVFGKPEFSMMVNLSKRENLARADIKEVTRKLEEEGFYVQMPPLTLSEQIQS
ncbi:MAG: YcgL domain-containing protein [Pseudomonadota bacterium]